MTASARIRRQHAVRIVADDSIHIGRVGIVTSVLKSTDEVIVMLNQTEYDAQRPITIDVANVVLDVLVTTADLQRYDARRAELRADEAERVATYKARRIERERAEYLEERRAAAIVAPLVRHVENEGLVCFGEQREGYVSDRITIYARVSEYSATPKISVNWSALGNVSPEEALAFAQSLAAAAVEAMAIRAAQERAAGLDVA